MKGNRLHPSFSGSGALAYYPFGPGCWNISTLAYWRHNASSKTPYVLMQECLRIPLRHCTGNRCKLASERDEAASSVIENSSLSLRRLPSVIWIIGRAAEPLKGSENVTYTSMKVVLIESLRTVIAVPFEYYSAVTVNGSTAVAYCSRLLSYIRTTVRKSGTCIDGKLPYRHRVLHRSLIKRQYNMHCSCSARLSSVSG